MQNHLLTHGVGASNSASVKRRILIVEDNAGLANILVENLMIEGFDVALADNGDDALAKAEQFTPDLIVLDVALPGRDGFELCRAFHRGRRTAIVMLTARSQKEDRVRGLNAGADVYVTKPFDLDELLAQIHAVLRRAKPEVESVSLGSITVDFRSLQAWSGDQRLDLTHREFELLRYLAVRQNSVVARKELLRHVWGHTWLPIFSRTVDQAIMRLRKKIETDPQHPRFIRTVLRDGYCLTPASKDK